MIFNLTRKYYSLYNIKYLRVIIDEIYKIRNKNKTQ